MMGKKGFILLMLLLALLGLSASASAEDKKQAEYGKQNKIPAGIQKEPGNTIDVLVIGDSLTYSTVTPFGLWRDYGITSYVCGQPGQMMAETYKTLKMALKDQKPKVVVFETNVLFRKQRAKDKRDWMDKLYIREDSKGFKMRDGVGPYEKGAYMKKTEKKEKMAKQVRRYMGKIVKLCRRHGARLVLASAPSPRNYNYRKHNTLKEYAKKKSLAYLDMNLITKKLKIDWRTDTMDQGDHLNLRDAKKATRYLGRYLKKRFGLAGHRGEAAYKGWERKAAEYEDMELEMLRRMQVMGAKTDCLPGGTILWQN